MKRLQRPIAAASAACALALPVGAAADELLAVWRAADAHDRALAVASAEHRATQALRAQADALWRPRLRMSVAAGVGAQETAMRGARFAAPGMGTVDDARFATSVVGGLATRVSVDARKPLIDAARRTEQAQLRIAADIGDTAWEMARSDRMLAIAERYFALALAEERVLVLDRQVEALARTRAETHDRYELGSSAVTDTHEADAAWAEVRAQRSAAALDLEVQRRALADSTGLAQPTARLPVRALAPVDDLASWLAAADVAHPRLRLLSQSVAAADQTLQQQRVSGRPTLDLAIQASHERIAGSGDFGSARSRSVDAIVGVQLNVPLYSGGMLQAREREAAERRSRAHAQLELAREEVRQQVRASWLGLQSGAARIAALRERLVASDARLDATRLGREVGDRTTRDVLDAENDRARAALELARAQADQVLMHLRLAAQADRLDDALLAAVDTVLAPAGRNASGKEVNDE